MTIRDFKTAALRFLESISTFTSYELMEYKKFVVYTVMVSMISLERTELRQKVDSFFSWGNVTRIKIMIK